MNISPGAIPSAESRPALSAEDAARLDALYEELSRLSEVSIGYPCNQRFDYGPLFRFLNLATNNVGDPFSGSNFRMNTHSFEREVLLEFASLAAIPVDRFWGYITNGGTEGNMYGLYLAREIFPEGMVYFSEHTHYSVAKILRLQHTRNIMIRSAPGGEIDYEDLEESIRIHREVTPIIFANVGTTMTGAIDNIARIREILDRLCVQQSYLHVDAALSGMILPFVKNPPPWNFAAGIDSLSISGHKMLGSPLPCGVALAKKSHVDRIARSVEYVGALDTTLSGSRNGITPLILWYALRSNGREGLRRMVKDCLATAAYAVVALQSIGVQAWRHEHSITVVFPRPPDEILRKWILAPYEDICHLIAVPSVTPAVIDAFVADLGRCGRSALDKPPPVPHPQ